MRRYTLIYCILFSTIAPITTRATQETAPSKTYDLLYNCYQLECLWHALYGPNHPLQKYIKAYKDSINEYSERHNTTHRVTPNDSSPSPEDSASLLITTQLQDQLFAVKNHATELLDQYELTSIETNKLASSLTIPEPSSYSAAPLPNIPTSEQDTVLQQVLAALQQLQTQKPAHLESNSATLKEQLALFTIGIVLLGCVTCITHRQFSKHIKKLYKKTKVMHQEMTTPHSDTKKCGVQAHLDCTIQQFNKRKK